MYLGLEIIDFHVHFPTRKPMFGGPHGPGPDRRSEYVERRGERRAKIARELAMDYNRHWRLTWGFDPPESDPPDDETQADRWAAELERYGLRAVGFVTGGGNDHLAGIVARHPARFVGFAHNYLFGENAAQEVKRGVEELGLRAYKLLAPALDRPIEDEAGYPVWEMCGELNIPVLVHFGILGSGGGVPWHENINPLKLYTVARDFPEVTFVIPHFGCAWIRETLQLCWACGNVCIDTSGSNQWVRWVDGEWNTKKLFRKYVETIGAERIIFGSDSSYFPRGFAIRYLQDQIRDCRELGLTDEQLRAIFSANAARLLKLGK
ncbi:MAG: amidohydrolase family protein [Anaerolineaceae bacterium]|nr:amidohydrolase family protein [Anaerolineaceae bacterium]